MYKFVLSHNPNASLIFVLYCPHMFSFSRSSSSCCSLLLSSSSSFSPPLTVITPCTKHSFDINMQVIFLKKYLCFNNNNNKTKTFNLCSTILSIQKYTNKITSKYQQKVIFKTLKGQKAGQRGQERYMYFNNLYSINVFRCVCLRCHLPYSLWLQPGQSQRCRQ